METRNTGNSNIETERNMSFAKPSKKPNAFSSCAQVFYLAGSEHSCINCFIVLRLREENAVINQNANTGGNGKRNSSNNECNNESNTSQDQRTMEFMWTYPYSAETVMTLYPHLDRFALANADMSYSADQLNYTFVLTNSSGMREYGHTTAFVNGDVVVIISPYPWCNFFFHIAYLYSCNGEENGQCIVRALAKCGTPPSGAEFLTPLELGISLKRPYDRLCAFIDTTPLSLLRVFQEIDLLFIVLADLLLEKHIVVVGPNFSIVSNVVMSLQALIAPFDWMHILIPILPSSLIDVLAAPPPYFVGMLHSQLHLLGKVDLDGVVLIYLNRHGLCERVIHHNETIDTLPNSGALSALRIGLNLLKYRHPRDMTVRDLCSLFMTYYASTFGEIVLSGAHTFYIEKHLHPKSNSTTYSFFSRLMCTQSFNILSEEVRNALKSHNLSWMDNEFVVAAVRGHRELYPEHHATLIAEEREGKGYVSSHGDCFGSHETFSSWTAAVHGFGGHRLSVPRLIGRCLWSSIASRFSRSQQPFQFSRPFEHSIGQGERHYEHSHSCLSNLLSRCVYPCNLRCCNNICCFPCISKYYLEEEEQEEYELEHEEEREWWQRIIYNSNGVDHDVGAPAIRIGNKHNDDHTETTEHCYSENNSQPMIRQNAKDVVIESEFTQASSSSETIVQGKEEWHAENAD